MKLEIELTEQQIREFAKDDTTGLSLGAIRDILETCKDWVAANPPPHEWKVGDWAYSMKGGISFKVETIDGYNLGTALLRVHVLKNNCVPCKEPEVKDL